MAVQYATFTLTAYATVTTNITGDLLRPDDGEWGNNSNSPEERMAGTGILEFDMDNFTTSGKYLPGHTSCMAGWKKGTKLDLKFTYDGDDVIKTYYVDTCQVAGALEERIHVVAVDWLEYSANDPLITPALLEDTTADTGITEALNSISIPPQATNLDVGVITLPTQLDTISRYTKIYSVIAQEANSELGYAYLTQPETLVFENLMRRNGSRVLHQVPVHSEDSGFLQDENDNTITDENDNPIIPSITQNVELVDADIINYTSETGKNIINRFVTSVHPRRTDTETVILYQPERPIYIASGESLNFREFYSDPVARRGINAVPPVEDNYTKALLQFEGVNGSQQTFPDSVSARIWTANDVELVSDVFGTAPKFHDTCAYLDGGTSYISTAHSPIFELLNQAAWTFDIWAYTFATTSNRTLINRDGTIAVPPYRFFRSNGTNYLIDISSNGSTFDIANGESAGSITTGQWVHHEIGKNGNNYYSFKNGVLISTWTSSATIFASTAQFMLGRNQSTYFDGTLAEFRFSLGICRHTASFTPETGAYQLQGTFVEGFTNENGTGTEITNDIDTAVAYGTEGAIYNLENGNASGGWLFIKTYGYGVHLDSPVEDAQVDQPSIDAHGVQETRLDMPYMQDTSSGILEGRRVIEQEKDSRTVLHSVETNANRSKAAMMRFLHTQAGDLVGADMTKIEKDAWFYVQGGKFHIGGAGLINHEWFLKETWTLNKGLDDLAIEFRGGANTDCLTFPYMPWIAGDEVTSFSISAWVYLDTEPVTLGYFVTGPYMDGAGSGLFIGTTDRKIQFYTSRFNVSPGQWTSNADPFALTTWAHIVMTWNISLSADPLLYVNGANVTFTETITPAGTLQSARGAPFFIGNVKTPALNYTRCFDGKIRDVRFYKNIELTQSQITTIYNGGTYNPLLGWDGMVFQAPAIFSNRLTAYTDLTLTSNTKLLDAYLLFVGTPNGSPIARLP